MDGTYVNRDFVGAIESIVAECRIQSSKFNRQVKMNWTVLLGTQFSVPTQFSLRWKVNLVMRLHLATQAVSHGIIILEVNTNHQR